MEFNMELITTLVIPFAIKLVIALAIFIIGKWVARVITRTSNKLLAKSGLDQMLVKFLGNLTYTVLLVAVVLASINSLGINVTSLLAVVGAAGLAVGLALKDSLSNFAAGVMIIIFRPFKIGDVINAGGQLGVVDEIGMFCTLMHTPDNQRIIIPNSAVINGTIININAMGTRRVDLVIGISYDDNIGTAKDIITRLVENDTRILKDPAFSIGVLELADSSVNLFVRPWVASGDFWAVKTELTEKIKVALDDAGITIPYPQRDVYMHTVEKSA
jgi:small conductance mechanosensitive channel